MTGSLAAVSPVLAEPGIRHAWVGPPSLLLGYSAAQPGLVARGRGDAPLALVSAKSRSSPWLPRPPAPRWTRRGRWQRGPTRICGEHGRCPGDKSTRPWHRRLCRGASRPSCESADVVGTYIDPDRGGALLAEAEAMALGPKPDLPLALPGRDPEPPGPAARGAVGARVHRGRPPHWIPRHVRVKLARALAAFLSGSAAARGLTVEAQAQAEYRSAHAACHPALAEPRRGLGTRILWCRRDRHRQRPRGGRPRAKMRRARRDGARCGQAGRLASTIAGGAGCGR